MAPTLYSQPSRFAPNRSTVAPRLLCPAVTAVALHLHPAYSTRSHAAVLPTTDALVRAKLSTNETSRREPTRSLLLL